MSTGALDPLIHDPGRLGVVATLAALPAGDRAQTTVTFTCPGRAALDRYTAMPRHLPQAARQDYPATSTPRARRRC